MEIESGAVDVKRRASDLFRWPVRILGPAPGLMEMNLACWGVFAGLFVLRFLAPLLLQLKTGGAASVHYPAVDFVYFYGIGHIANQYPLTSLYDFNLQLKTFHALAPLTGVDYGPSPYPPFVALIFSVFARVSFMHAFLLWAGISLSLYLAGIASAAKDSFHGEWLKVSLTFCFAVAFCPFLLNTFANGQIATVAVFSVGFAISQEKRARPFSSGLVLSILVYKPTLLLLLVPMLLLTRRYRAFWGLIAGAVLLVLASTAIAGIQIWAVYAHFLRFFGQRSGLGGSSLLFLRQYVELRSFLPAICGGRSTFELAILILSTATIAAVLALLLWKSVKGGRATQSLAWAATLTWTLLLNVYVPVYDSILVSVAAVLTLGALMDLKWSAATGWTIFLLVLMGTSSWELNSIGVSHGIQFLTIPLAILGLGQLYFLHRAIRQESPQEINTLAAR